MSKLPDLVNEVAVRNLKILGYWVALDQHTDLTWSEKLRKTSEKYCLGEETIHSIIKQQRKRYPEDFET